MLQQLINNLEVAQKAIREYKDGYKYIVEITSYGSIWTREYDNSYMAIDHANEYNGDNGFSVIYTDNQELLNEPGYNGIQPLSNYKAPKGR